MWLLSLPLLFSQGTCHRAAGGRGQHWEVALKVVPNLQVRNQGGGGEGLATAIVQAYCQADEQCGQEEGSGELKPQQGGGQHSIDH